MKSKIKNIIKYNRWIYIMYYFIFNLLIRTFAIFIKTDNNLILINSFAGRKYDDSPKCIYEEMRKDKRIEYWRV